MPKIKIRKGDKAVVVEPKSCGFYHCFPLGTVVHVGERMEKKLHGFNLYYCIAEGGDCDGVTQLVATHSLEKIK